MQRNARRFSVSLPFEMDGRSLGSSRDVSLGGAFIKTVLRPQLGTRHQVAVVCGKETFDVEAQVVRHGTDGVAVAFDESTGSFSRHLIQVLGPDAEREDDLKGR